MAAKSRAPSRTPYKVLESERAEPIASSMLDSMRAVGYSTEAAVADLIDNSITAGARHVWLRFWWSGKDSAVVFEDDGSGMGGARLFEAMRLGTRGPEGMRSPSDLGRFGLGLKTASLSQCRRLTVRSWTTAAVQVTRCWDLDYVQEQDDWLLLKEAFPDSESHLKRPGRRGAGTVVVWEHLDRMVGDVSTEDETAKNHFLERIDRISEHLSMVFHRYLEGHAKLTIALNDKELEPWDPFLSKETATQSLGDETLNFQGCSVLVRPYVLPHHSKVSKDVHARAAGPLGWNAQQGYYVYRNRRLLVSGDWLGLGFQKEEHCKLARILVDLPNTMDDEWQIDVKKSKARPPAALRRDLKRIARLTRNRAVEIYRHRGKVLTRTISPQTYVWLQKLKAGKIHYEINREHPLIVDLLTEPKPLRSKLKALMRLIEETIPIPTIAFHEAEKPDSTRVPFDDADALEIRELGRIVHAALLSSGMTRNQAADRLRTLEPFLYYPVLVAEILGEP